MKNINYRLYDKRYIGRKTINKETITVYGKTQEECLKKLKQRLKEVKQENNLVVFPSNNFITLWNKWVEQTKKPVLQQASLQDIDRVKNKIKELHNLSLSKIDKDLIFELLKKFDEGRSKEKLITYLKAFFNYAVAENKIKTNPFNNLIIKPNNKKSRNAFSYEEQVKILEAIHGQDIEPIILTYLVTGLRKQEMNFQSIEKDIDINNQILKANNLKGRNKIARYKKIKLSKAAISLIMNNLDKFKANSAYTTYIKFAKILKENNINGSINTLRHTFATNCFYLGKPELIISREMGHSNTEITKTVYTDIDYNLSKEKVLKLYKNLYNLD